MTSTADERRARGALLARIVPLAAPRSGRLVERNLMVYRRTWMVIFSGFFEPLFYLLGIGFGIGALVGRSPRRTGARSRTRCSSRRRSSRRRR